VASALRLLARASDSADTVVKSAAAPCVYAALGALQKWPDQPLVSGNACKVIGKVLKGRTGATGGDALPARDLVGAAVHAHAACKGACTA
jgi:hypothetical protein